jgi:tetratricopeptide (TPR) repeat protein
VGAASAGFSHDDFSALPSFDDIDDLDAGPAPNRGATQKSAVAGPTQAGDLGDDDLFGSPVPPGAKAATQTGQAGSTNYGEVSLAGGGGLDDLDDLNDLGSGSSGIDTDDGMEFGGIPQEEEGASKPSADPSQALDTRGSERPRGSAAASAAVQRGATPEVNTPKKKNTGRIALAALLLTAVAGGALALVPSVGPFGMHVIMDSVNQGQHEQLLATSIKRIQTQRGSDLFADARATVLTIEQARQSAERFAPLAAYSASLHYALVLRYGSLPEVQAAAKVLVDTLIAQGASSEVPSFPLALAAQFAVGGEFDKARTQLTRLKASDPGNLDVLTLLGELELGAQRFAEAQAVWAEAVGRQESAWTHYGLARSQFGAGDLGAKASAEATLKLNPKHPGAKLLLAELSRQADDEATATTLVDQVLELGEATSIQERVTAHTLLAEMHLTRGRTSKAEGEFDLALQLDPKDERALVGLGNSFFQAGRHAAALARFEAAVSSVPTSVGAQVGVAKAQLALEKLDEARQLLTELVKTHPKDPMVLFWFGKAAEASKDRALAQQSYETAAANGAQTIHAVNAYVALAELFSQAGDLESASQRLKEAANKMPGSSLLHKALGDVASSRGSYEEALAEYQKAQALDRQDIGSTFKTGSALRRLKRFDEAWSVFEQVAKVDKDLPGLPLERGLLLEESGRSAEALKEYEAAFSKSPDDLDIMLRVGCGRMAAGNGSAAAEVLRHVLAKRPKSAETSHCLGRALFQQSQGLEALRFLQQAVSAESNRAEYHLYVGWVANELGQVAVAQEALTSALALDQGLAEAHWQQGVLLLARGAGTESVNELKKALELKPSRHEVHADLAQAYYQLGNEVRSLEQWALAIAADDKQPTWLFRYGKLLHARSRNTEAARLLVKAIALSADLKPRPSWLWQAHQLAASSLGVGPEAVAHWRKFLEIGPEDSPYREDAKRALAAAGEPWKGN